jgi:hypothetical protein
MTPSLSFSAHDSYTYHSYYRPLLTFGLTSQSDDITFADRQLSLSLPPHEQTSL